MSDTVKLIVEIPKNAKQAFDKAESNDLKGGYYDHGGIIGKAIQNGTPLPKGHGRLIDADKLIGKIHGVRSITAVLDAPTIIEADMRESIGEKIRCNTCVNSDDEFSGECYECVKGIFDHYETEVEHGRTND